jgi:mitogen-activated protein kinase kinase
MQAIVDGEPPDLPDEGFSDASRNFVRGCLNKIPNSRPTYAMLLQHPWLAPLIKPETITEEDEDEVIAAEEAQADAAAGDVGSPEPSDDVVDKEVADWVKDAIDKRKRGVLGKGVPKPALHAAPLDAVPSPSQSDVNGLDAGAPEAAAAASDEAAA